MEDLLYVFMGYEGQYIRYARGYSPNEERDRLSGPPFRILPGLDPSLHDLTKSMLKMATYYSALEAFVDVQSREEFGAVNHALCASVRKCLQDYLVMIAQLETQFLTSETFTVHVLNIHTLPTCQMLSHLYAMAQELLKKNALLDDESDEEDDDEVDDYDKVLERLAEGGELVPGSSKALKVCKGGGVLGLLASRLESLGGDPAARSLLTSLLRDASRPYMKMLNEWLHHGSIHDPHSEFMIREQKSIGRERLERDYIDEYWERRYTIRDQDVPPQLEGVKEKVLLAGKYLNVVRECGGVDVSKIVTELPTSFDDKRFLENVNNAYAHANESLMQLLLTTHELPLRLRSLKHYFFLDPSDSFSYFLELGSSELRKNVKSVNTSKLQSLLDLVLRQPGTVASLDPFKEDVKVEMNEVTLINNLQRVVNITGIESGQVMQPVTNQPPIEPDKNATGFTSLQLDYSVPFPVSLVISRKTVWRYQALFRFLLSLRYLESQLSTTWQTHTRGVIWAHKGSNNELETWKRRAWTLRARMLVYVQQVLYFCTSEVIEPNWAKFMSRLKAKDETSDRKSGFNRTVDELMQDHVDFLDTCLKECMLTNSKLLKASTPVLFLMHSAKRPLGQLQAHANLHHLRRLHGLPVARAGKVRPRLLERPQARQHDQRPVAALPGHADRQRQRRRRLAHRVAAAAARRLDARGRRGAHEQPVGDYPQVGEQLWAAHEDSVGLAEPLCRDGDGGAAESVCAAELSQPGHRVGGDWGRGGRSALMYKGRKYGKEDSIVVGSIVKLMTPPFFMMNLVRKCVLIRCWFFFGCTAFGHVESAQSSGVGIFARGSFFFLISIDTILAHGLFAL